MTVAEPAWPVARPVAGGMMAIGLLVLGFGLWTGLMPIAAAIAVPGVVEVADRRQPVQHPDGGQVARLAVHEGDHVEAGDILLTLDGDVLRTQRAILAGQYHEILARRGRMEAERDGADAPDFAPGLLRAAAADPAVQGLIRGQAALFAARRTTLSQEDAQLAERRRQLRRAEEGLAAQAGATDRQTELIARELADQRTLLDKGLTQAARVLALEREAAALAGTAGEILAQRGEIAARQAEIALERTRLVSTRQEDALRELRDLGYRELEIAERLSAAEAALSRLTLVAAEAGTVHGLTVSPGSVLRPGDTAMSIVPDRRPRVIAVRIAARDAEQVFSGQTARIRPPHGDGRAEEIAGTLERLSADAFADERTGTGFYRGEITVPPETALRPGLPVEVFLRTGEHTALEYLTRPLIRSIARAWREG